ncbi:hypothetical protein M9H77_04238 [Catharanthus roseus]|uniref:Uncharacterized protein n=1 Tax=Catharanthus roseus TaxID=4058 RepID=A0ACC0CDP4_CATRO|nr:hypothetical protein M9H77_04238 [Catharanthus roseus]
MTTESFSNTCKTDKENRMRLAKIRRYNCGRSSSRPLSYNNLKLLLLWGTFDPYDYEAWEQEVESLFYSYGVREEEKFHWVQKSLSYEKENRIKTNQEQALRNKCGVVNHEDKDKQSEGGTLAYKSIKTNSSKVKEEHLPTRFSSISCAIPRVDEYYFNISDYASHMLGDEEKGRNMEKELGTILEELPISLSLNPSLSFYEASFEELKISLEYSCTLTLMFGRNHTTEFKEKEKIFGKELSLCHEDSSISPFLNPSILSHKGAYDDLKLFLESYISYFKEKYVEYCESILPFFETFMNDFVGVISLNPSLLFLNKQVEFLCHEQKLLNVIKSLNTLMENIFGFQFCHLHFKELLLNNFENQMGAYLEMFKDNPLTFVKSILRKETFEQVCKELVVGHLYYHKPFKEWFWKNSCSSMWSKIHIFFGSFVESGYDERVTWISWSLCGDFHAKFKGELVENCDYVSSFIYASMKNFDGFIPSILLLGFASHHFEFPYDEQKVLNVGKFLKALIGNIHGFQFYHFHFKEFMWLLICGKKMNGSFKVLNLIFVIL